MTSILNILEEMHIQFHRYRNIGNDEIDISSAAFKSW